LMADMRVVARAAALGGLLALVCGYPGPALAQDELAHFEKGVKLAREGKTSEAVPEILAAVELNPSDPIYRNWLGSLYYDLKEYDKAIVQLDAAAERGEVWKYYRAMSYFKGGRFVQVKSLLEAALQGETKEERRKELETALAAVTSYKEHMVNAASMESQHDLKGAKREFEAAFGAVPTQEAREGRDRVAATIWVSRKKAIQMVALALCLAFLGAVGSATMRAQRRNAERESLLAKMKQMVASADLKDAKKLYERFLAVGGATTSVEPAVILAVYDGGDPARVLSEAPLTPEQVVSISKLLFDRKKFKNAMDFYKEYLPQATRGRETGPFKPEELVQMHVEAGGDLSAVVALPVSAPVIMSLARRFAEKKKPKEAIQVLGGGALLGNLDSLAAAAEFYDILKTAGQSALLLSMVDEQGEALAGVVLTGLAEAVEGDGDHSTAVAIVTAKSKGKPRRNLDARDYDVLLKAMAGMKSIEAGAMELIPDKMRHQVAEVMMNKGMNKEALKFMTSRPRSQWTENDLGVVLRLYIHLDMLEVAQGLMAQLRSEMPLAKSPDLYYAYGVACEEAGHLKEAFEVYKMFIVESVIHADVTDRYAAVKEGIADEPAPSGKRPTSKKRVTGPARDREAQGRMTLVGEGDDAPDMLGGGRYQILRELGRGGMAVVYEGKDMQLSRQVAIKRMKDELGSSRKAVQDFMKEASFAAKLGNHPNIVTVYDVIEDEGVLYLILECVEGESLALVLERDGRQPLPKVVRVFRQVCEAIQYAHEQNVIHRDLKPSNILLAKGEKVKVTDFGIARIAKDTLTRATGEQTGTPAYMSPEQHLGSADRRGDIYSMGVMLYEMVAGEIPFGGPDFLAQKERMYYKPLAEHGVEVPAALETIVTRCLQADRAKRYATVAELAADLGGISSLGKGE